MTILERVDFRWVVGKFGALRAKVDARVAHRTRGQFNVVTFESIKNFDINSCLSKQTLLKHRVSAYN